MGANFDIAVEIILKHEGGLTDDPTDRGGITNYGITLPILREMGMAGDLNHDGHIDPEDIKGMSLEEAKEIYRARWWDRFGYGTIPSQRIATKLFDECVNFGWHQGHVILQRALNMVEDLDLNLKLDGDLGTKTMKAVGLVVTHSMDDALVNNLRTGMGYVYGLIIQKDPTQKSHEMGWLRRAAW
jgi:lysozyme family protein